MNESKNQIFAYISDRRVYKYMPCFVKDLFNSLQRSYTFWIVFNNDNMYSEEHFSWYLTWKSAAKEKVPQKP